MTWERKILTWKGKWSSQKSSWIHSWHPFWRRMRGIMKRDFWFERTKFWTQKSKHIAFWKWRNQERNRKHKFNVSAQIWRSSFLEVIVPYQVSVWRSCNKDLQRLNCFLRRTSFNDSNSKKRPSWRALFDDKLHVKLDSSIWESQKRHKVFRRWWLHWFYLSPKVSLLSEKGRSQRHDQQRLIGRRREHERPWEVLSESGKRQILRQEEEESGQEESRRRFFYGKW